MTFEKIWEMAAPFVKMALILIVGHFLIIFLQKLLNKAFVKAKWDRSLIHFLDKTVSIIAHGLVIVSALSAIGVSTTGLIAAFSAVAVGVAMSLKDSLGNIAGGILLLMSPRFSTGDYIAAGGDEGTVTNIDLLHTTVLTLDNKQVSIPNGVLINSHIINYSREEKRRVDITFPISYESDLKTAQKTAAEVIRKHPLTLTEEQEPFVRVSGYADSAVNLLIRVWCKTENYWDVYYDLTEQIRAAFDQNGVTIPYNRLEVQIRENSPRS